jgi:hypothetical protein
MKPAILTGLSLAFLAFVVPQQRLDADANVPKVVVDSRSITEYNYQPIAVDGTHNSFVWMYDERLGLGMYREDGQADTKGYFGYFPDLEGSVLVTSARGAISRYCNEDRGAKAALVGWNNRRADLFALASDIRCPKGHTLMEARSQGKFRVHEESGGVGLVNLTVDGRALGLFELPSRPNWANSRFGSPSYSSILMRAWQGKQHMAMTLATDSDNDKTAVFVADNRCTAGVQLSDFRTWSAILHAAAATEPFSYGLKPVSIRRPGFETRSERNKPSTISDFILPDLCGLTRQP